MLDALKPWVVVSDSLNTCVPVQVIPRETVGDVKNRMKLGLEPHYWPDRDSRRIFFQGEPLRDHDTLAGFGSRLL